MNLIRDFKENEKQVWLGTLLAEMENMIKTQGCEVRQDLLLGNKNYKGGAHMESSEPGTDNDRSCSKNKETEAQEGGCSRFLEDSFVYDFSADHSSTSHAQVPSVLQQQTCQVLRSKVKSKSSAVF